MSRRIVFPVISLSVITLLSACSTPQERCINTAANTVNMLQNGITTAHSNISRGYAVHKSQEEYEVVDTCYDSNKKPYVCSTTEYRTVETPVALNVVEEERKIRRLERRLPAARRQMEADIAQCRLNYPS